MPDVTPDALARIESTAATLGSLACVACPEHVSPAQEDTLECLLRTDVPALVAALREAWAERDRLLRAVRAGRTADADEVRAERDEARAALARVEALCDDEAWKVSDFWLMGDAIRAAITGPTPTDRVDGSGNGAGAVADGAP